jgi:flagellar assembly protein FliH
MTIAHLLEDFTMPSDGSPVQMLSEDMLEDQRLASFEQGYSAGWDDAVQAQEKETSRISSGLASNLEDLSFTYHEALSQMNANLAPLFRGLADKVLPDTMSAAFGQHVADEIMDMARDQVEQPVFLVVSPGEQEVVRNLLERNGSITAKVRSDQLLSPGQAYLRVGDSEREIDCNALTESIRKSIDAFIHQTREDRKHG